MKRLQYSFKNAFQGIAYIFLTQMNFRVHLGIAGLVILVALFLHVSITGLVLLFLTIGFVLVTECINTAIERAVDLATQSFDPIAKNSKDAAAASVMVAAIIAVIIGLVILIPPLIEWIQSH